MKANHIAQGAKRFFKYCAGLARPAPTVPRGLGKFRRRCQLRALVHPRPLAAPSRPRRARTRIVLALNIAPATTPHITFFSEPAGRRIGPASYRLWMRVAMADEPIA